MKEKKKRPEEMSDVYHSTTAVMRNFFRVVSELYQRKESRNNEQIKDNEKTLKEAFQKAVEKEPEIFYDTEVLAIHVYVIDYAIILCYLEDRKLLLDMKQYLATVKKAEATHKEMILDREGLNECFIFFVIAAVYEKDRRTAKKFAQDFLRYYAHEFQYSEQRVRLIRETSQLAAGKELGKVKEEG